MCLLIVVTTAVLTLATIIHTFFTRIKSFIIIKSVDAFITNLRVRLARKTIIYITEHAGSVLYGSKIPRNQTFLNTRFAYLF